MDLTFLIPVKIESEDRVRNLTTVLTYILKKFDAKILVQEHDKVQRFNDLVLPNIPKSDNIEYTFDLQTNNYFHKTKILNDLLLKSDTEVVCNYDTDVLLPEKTYTEAYQLIKTKKYDVVYPYGCGIYQKAVTYTQETFEKFLNSDLNVQSLDKHARIHNSTIGWCQFISRENYIKSFMMNENFHAWGPEDSEFYYRLSVLGNRIARINDFVYHLEHSRSNDSWFSNPLWRENTQLWHWIQSQSGETFLNYYQNQDYYKRRLKDVRS